MLLDWVTAKLPLLWFDAAALSRLQRLGDRVQRYNAQTGEIVYELQAWDSIRSDSHQLAYRVASDSLQMQGSPARVIGDGDAVFGAGPSRALDLVGCVERMRETLAMAIGVVLPPAARWKVTRVDITANLLLPNLADVRAALAVLRNCEGGRYRVSQQAGDTAYWSHRSRLRSGKAYAKGPHLRYLMKQTNHTGRHYDDDELAAAERLLRLELSLRAQWWRERAGKSWTQITASELRDQWGKFFERMMGDTEVTEMKIEQRVYASAATEGQAKAAIGCWALIKAYGWEKARAMTTRSKWYKDLKVLRAAGLSDADLSAGNVVPFRRPLIQCQQIESWDELMAIVEREREAA